ncbi:MAG: PIN domain-containing protein [Planctomycetaceae bacterium]|nr:PIN domain-containing protein [Planctomycetaceae bacterium]
MFLVDTSVWLAQAFGTHPHHAAAKSAIARTTPEKLAVFCRATEQSFLRLVSTPAVQRRYGMTEISNEEALRMLERLSSLPNIAFRDEPAGIVAQWYGLARRKTASPKVWMDAYLAAFAIAAGLTFLTLDADFRKFERSGLTLNLLPGS